MKWAKWAAGILAVLVYLAWPYYALYDLAQGIRSGDAATINQRVDWDSVRASVKAQVQTILTSRPMMAMQRQNPNSAVGDATRAATMANSFIDTTLTPEGIANMLQRLKAAETPNKSTSRMPIPRLSEREIEALFGSVKFAFFVSPVHFRLDLGSPNRNGSTDALTVRVMMTLKGTRWQVTDVRLANLDMLKI